MDLLHRFKTLLDIKGISYAEADDSLQMVLCSSVHKWKCAVTADDSGFLTIYSRYPWKVPHDRRYRLLCAMNLLNESTAAGCFMINGDSAVFRYSVYISEPLLFAEVAQRHFAAAAAMTDDAWNRIYPALYAAEV